MVMMIGNEGLEKVDDYNYVGQVSVVIPTTRKKFGAEKLAKGRKPNFAQEFIE